MQVFRRKLQIGCFWSLVCCESQVLSDFQLEKKGGRNKNQQRNKHLPFTFAASKPWAMLFEASRFLGLLDPGNGSSMSLQAMSCHATSRNDVMFSAKLCFFTHSIVRFSVKRSVPKSAFYHSILDLPTRNGAKTRVLSVQHAINDDRVAKSTRKREKSSFVGKFHCSLSCSL